MCNEYCCCYTGVRSSVPLVRVDLSLPFTTLCRCVHQATCVCPVAVGWRSGRSCAARASGLQLLSLAGVRLRSTYKLYVFTLHLQEREKIIWINMWGSLDCSFQIQFFSSWAKIHVSTLTVESLCRSCWEAGWCRAGMCWLLVFIQPKSLEMSRWLQLAPTCRSALESDFAFLEVFWFGVCCELVSRRLLIVFFFTSKRSVSSVPSFTLITPVCVLLLAQARHVLQSPQQNFGPHQFDYLGICK